MRIERAIPAFSCGFMIVYLISMFYHPMFTYFTYVPRQGQWAWGVPALGAQGPGMFWWSWLSTALVAGLVCGGAALATPENVRAKVPSSIVWIVPVVLIVILLYIERTWFGYK